jgi:hypothetical protein
MDAKVRLLRHNGARLDPASAMPWHEGILETENPTVRNRVRLRGSVDEANVRCVLQTLTDPRRRARCTRSHVHRTAGHGAAARRSARFPRRFRGRYGARRA